MARKLKLVRSSASCESVNVRSPYVSSGYPIGEVCRADGGFTYSSFPITRVSRGPVRTKRAAILKVVRAYQSWIGTSLRGA